MINKLHVLRERRVDWKGGFPLFTARLNPIMSCQEKKDGDGFKAINISNLNLNTNDRFIANPFFSVIKTIPSV